MDLRGVAGKKIALGVCGGIAAYKVVEVARQLTQAGADVHVVMTPSATNFIGPITFSTLTNNPVRTELFPSDAPSQIPHTDLGRTSDIVLIAPATAQTMAKYAQGVSDSLVTALLLSARCPIVMAPAMHTEMWEDSSTVANVRILRSKGVRFVGPETGALAGPDKGVGRLAAPDQILDAVDDELTRSEDLSGYRVLVTAGGTREPIDPVRFVGNRSSGRMGVEVASEALRRGAKVELICGPSSLPLPDGADVVAVETAEQMRDAVGTRAGTADLVIMAAAVADYRPKEVSDQKIKKSDGPQTLVLERTTDILEGLTKVRPKGQIIVGFCAETQDLEANARQKLQTKNVDLMVGNLVGAVDSGFDAETNQALILSRDGRAEHLPMMSKRQLAREILDRARPLLGPI